MRSGLPRVQQITVDGSSPLDARVNAFRSDIADIALAAKVAAQHYILPVSTQARVAIANVLEAPGARSATVSQLLYGEVFHVLERRDSWSWGRCAHDGYVGYVATEALSDEDAPAPTHRVRAAATHGFEAASIKSPVVRPLFRGSRVTVVGTDGAFACLADGSFVRQQALAPTDQFDTDWLQLAGDLLETPYLWGGRSRAGIDCSGLVQISLAACGIPCPRDTDMQRSLGNAVLQPEWNGQLRRGDLVFFPGHVGIMVDSQLMIHANAHHMKTVIEPLGDVVDRLLPEHADPISAVRRLESAD